MILFHKQWKRNQEIPKVTRIPVAPTPADQAWSIMTIVLVMFVMSYILYTTDWSKNARPCCPGRLSCGCSE